MQSNLKTIKQFAKENGITVQAVYKKMNSKNNGKRLNGYIINYQGMKCLDEIAQEILSPCNQNKEIEMKLTQSDMLQDKVFEYLETDEINQLEAKEKQLIGFHLINFTRNFMRR